MMKLKFKDQQFQTDAVNSITGLFRGQEKKNSVFSIIEDRQISLIQNDYGIGNLLTLTQEQIEANMHDIQMKNNLPKTALEDDIKALSFCVEMETGSGKTMVYSKTILELNKQYGFTKFIIVVPSVAIREGVYKFLEITREYFATLYDNVPYRFFIYNSAKLSEIRRFATASDIEVMIINIDAFRKSENIINQAHDKLNGESAMRYIQDTSPIVIIDEPQSVDNTEKAKEAIASLNPLCVLRYSATHKEKINLMYRLTPVDAYQMGLVKQICVSSNQSASGFNKPYIRLVDVSMDKGFKAKVEIDVKGKDGKVTRKLLTVKPKADLFILSGERELYDGYIIEGIDCTQNFECIEFGNTEKLKLGQAMGIIDEYTVKKAQIKRTIETHLEKELRLTGKGIKVLSLFFIDEVKKYRDYDSKDTRGVYAEMFEESYVELMALPKFAALNERFYHPIDKIHDGYFSQDKKGNYKNTKGDTQDDYNTYNTIMRDKEWLLSFDCPLRFIFSHSALKEGWDNPNVFQVCTLIDQKSTFTCRQKVGRGLRLCVDQNGERIEDKNINILHVMATETFADFAETLQKEIEQETGLKFGVLDIGLFSGLTYTKEIVSQKKVEMPEAKMIMDFMVDNGFMSKDGKPTEEAKATFVDGTKPLPPQLETAKDTVTQAISKGEAVKTEDLIGATYDEKITVEQTVGYEEAQELIKHFEDKGYITKTGKIKDTMKNDLLNGTLNLPKKYESAKEKFENVIKKADNKPPIRDAARDVVVRLNNQVMASPEFMALWDKIKQKTAYRVNVDSESLKKRCVKELREIPPLPKARIVTRLADINIKKSGVTHTETETRTAEIKDEPPKLPDILLVLQDECGLPLSLARDILFESGRLKDFSVNPQMFIENCVDIVKSASHQHEIDGIRYIKLDGEEYYLQEIFEAEELMANLDKNAVAVKNSAYDYIIYDSETVERPFAIALDNDPDVKMFFKIPEKFKIETPIGTYNPDWAVFMDKDGVQKMYFVLETKGSLSQDDRRGTENQKIFCGKQHFKALENDIELEVARTWSGFKVNN